MSYRHGVRLPAVAAALLALALVPSSTSAPSSGAADPLDAALSYLGKNAPAHGVTKLDVADMTVASSYRSAHSGVTHVNLEQRYKDLEVFGGQITVNVDANGRVIFAAGSLVRDLDAASGSVKVDAVGAVEAAAEGLKLEKPADVEVISRDAGPAQETVLSGGGISGQAIPARLGWQPTASGLRKAWQLVIDDSSDVHLWHAAVDAETGKLLAAEDWASDDSLDDLAATLQRPAARAFATSALAAGSPNPVADGSSYRVFALPKESPNDGPRALETNPADDAASPFGWHDTNGAPGPEFTITRGNNVHAYLDQDNNDAADFGGSPDGGASLTFDFPADLAEHAQNYREAAVTNLSYWNNTIHDIMWRYGFNEAAGNFQSNNYGRGGTAGDYVRAEAADGGGTNNANFLTPAVDGGVPRMQMYLWPGAGPQNQVVVDGLGSFDASWARFAPAPTVAGTAGRIFNAGNGCTVADYAAAAGNLAIVTGSNAGCQNVDKARRASEAGVRALIVALNAAGAAPVLTGSLTTAAPTIPVASITQADGNAIRAVVAAGPTTGTVRKHPSHPGIRDGDFENGIIIHEYGHGVSLRLTGGPTTNCLTGDEQAGEGWSDYLAIVTLLDPELDDPEGPRGMGPYALFQDSRQGAGIRPRPYSRNMEIQPFTYDSIKSNGWLGAVSLAAPHGIGHGWAAVLWDVTWDLIDKHGFNPDVYGAWNTGGNNRSLQYVIDGLKLQGCAPGFVVARAAIVAAANALGGGGAGEVKGDACTLWASFARRGLGFGAIQGSTARDDNSEAFDTHPACRRGFLGSVGDQPKINVVKVGATVPLVFDGSGTGGGLDVLASNSPYSRQVDCRTLRVVAADPPRITPRALPVPTRTPGKSHLSYDPTTGRYTYPWSTDAGWAGTCREAVVTRKDGIQHRAYFRFDSAASFTLSGRVRDVDGQPVPNATVTLADTVYSPATTDANGFYTFDAVAKGTYEATASAGGCSGAQTKTVAVSGPTTLDFSLPERRDGFGYTCRLVVAGYEEADTVRPITGDDSAGTIDLPFPFTFHGFAYTRAHVCTNGFLEFVGPAATTCPFTNVAIPATARPNGAIYPFWDDLLVDANASIRTEVKGVAPNRRFVVEWRNVHFFQDTSRRIDFNVVLHEDGRILTQYRNVADDGRERGDSATIGIENHAGAIALQYSLNQALLAAEPAVTTIRYTPPDVASFSVSGHVRDAAGQPIANAAVTIAGTPLGPATTDATGFYSFAALPAGTYDATAAAGCKAPQTKELVVSGATTLDFTLAQLADAFGYTCTLEDAAFAEGGTVLTAIAGDDVAGTIDLPFPFTLYGVTSTQAHVCSNGFVEFVGPTATTCPFGNVAIPATARPNGVVYGFWDDLFVDAPTATVRTGESGVAPNRRFVIEWRNVRFLGDTTRRIDFNVVLHEDGRILTQYRNLANDGRERGDSATLGLENGAGTLALQYSLNTAVLGSEPAVTSILYRPPGG